MSFTTPVDIANRAAELLGKPRIYSLFPPDNSDVAVECNFAYDKLRDAELGRNLWTHATRKCAVRMLDTTSVNLTFEAWSSSYTYVDGSSGYPAGYVVKYTDNKLWVSLANANTSTPDTAGTEATPPSWERYYGNLIANSWNDTLQNGTSTTQNSTYHIGELVYIANSGDTDIYVSVAENNQNQPDAVDAYDSATMYSLGAVVSSGGTNYQSKANLNFGNAVTNTTWWQTSITQPTVSNSWIELSGATVAHQPIIYPVGAGPLNDSTTKNVFRKPHGFMRIAPQSPHTGVTWFGSPVGLPMSDLTSEGDYLTTGYYQATMILRFVARIVDVNKMSDLFCEGLAARLAMELAPSLAPAMLKDSRIAYTRAITDARQINAIEVGPIEPPEDEWISVRA